MLKLITSISILLLSTFCHAQNTKSDPYASILGKTGDTIRLSRSAIPNWKTVNTTMPELVEVKEFMISASAGGNVAEFRSKSNKVTPDMKKYLLNNNNLRYFYVESINVKMPDQTVRRLSPMVVFLTK